MLTQSALPSPILVLSSHTCPQLPSPINHQLYCLRHGYDYLFDATPYPVKSGYDQKLHSIIANLPRSEWLLWMDDDAFFMNHNIALAQFIPTDPSVDFVFCDSPVDSNGRWTTINSGVFFCRNTTSTRELLAEALSIDISTVMTWWKKDMYGYFTNGDQDKLVYTFATRGLIGNRVLVRPFLDFNARPYHFVESADAFLICHLAGVSSKDEAIRDLRRRFALNPYLMANEGAMDFENLARYSLFNPERVALLARSRNSPRLTRIVRKIGKVAGLANL
jgi:hypothetical protein